MYIDACIVFHNLHSDIQENVTQEKEQIEVGYKGAICHEDRSNEWNFLNQIHQNNLNDL